VGAGEDQEAPPQARADGEHDQERVKEVAAHEDREAATQAGSAGEHEQGALNANTPKEVISREDQAAARKARPDGEHEQGQLSADSPMEVATHEDQEAATQARADGEHKQGQLSADRRPSPLSKESGAGLVYALRGSVEALSAPDGQLYMLVLGGSDLAVPEPDETDRALLQALLTPSTVAELIAATGAQRAAIEDKLGSLEEAGVLTSWPADTPPLSEEDARRFDRQLPYLAEFGAPAELQRGLCEATVAFIGCGGLGTWGLGALACAGVGRFVLVDDDVVEPSNLNRQVLYVEADVGRLKVDCAAEWVRRFALKTEVTTIQKRICSAEDVVPLARAADFLVMVADWPPYELERWVNQACVAERTPFISCGQGTPIMKIGPIYVPGRSPCFACHETQMRAEAPLYDEVVEMRKAIAAAVPAMTLGPAAGVVGTLLSMEVMHALLGQTAATEGRAMLLDIQTLQSSWHDVKRDPDCAVCGGLR
jgi:bacteriocin biosynthesis cyclodehydratase domain-containing protein